MSKPWKGFIPARISRCTEKSFTCITRTAAHKWAKPHLLHAAAYDYGVSFAHILLCTSFLFGVFYVLTNALQARGAATESLIVNISRQELIYIPSMFILGAIFHETGLIWAQPVADVLSLLLAIGLYFRMSGKGND